MPKFTIRAALATIALVAFVCAVPLAVFREREQARIAASKAAEEARRSREDLMKMVAVLNERGIRVTHYSEQDLGTAISLRGGKLLPEHAEELLKRPFARIQVEGMNVTEAGRTKMKEQFDEIRAEQEGEVNILTAKRIPPITPSPSMLARTSDGSNDKPKLQTPGIVTNECR